MWKRLHYIFITDCSMLNQITFFLRVLSYHPLQPTKPADCAHELSNIHSIGVSSLFTFLIVFFLGGVGSQPAPLRGYSCSELRNRCVWGGGIWDAGIQTAFSPGSMQGKLPFTVLSLQPPYCSLNGGFPPSPTLKQPRLGSSDDSLASPFFIAQI